MLVQMNSFEYERWCWLSYAQSECVWGGKTFLCPTVPFSKTLRPENVSGSTSNHRAPYFCKASWGSDWLQQLPCKPVWIKYVKTYADCVAHAQDYRVESACCIWDRTKSPCQTKKERNSVWQTNGSFPASESDFWRRGCSGGLPGLLSSIHQPVHPPGKTGGTVYEGSSATLGLPPQQQRNGCTHQARGDGWRVSMQR